MIKYQVNNQLTGLPVEANSFDEIKTIRDNLKNEYFDTLKELFLISVLVQNEDGSWTQGLADDNGFLIQPPVLTPEEIEYWNDFMSKNQPVNI